MPRRTAIGMRTANLPELASDSEPAAVPDRMQLAVEEAAGVIQAGRSIIHELITSGRSRRPAPADSAKPAWKLSPTTAKPVHRFGEVGRCPHIRARRGTAGLAAPTLG
jgi:hypothetical protein